MKYLIDGYNWFFRKFKERGSFLQDHTEFINVVVKLFVESKDFFSIVFDGKGLIEIESYGPNIQIIYSGENQSADDCILEFLESRMWKGCTVVTSDVTLSKKASTLGAKTFSIEEFLRHQKKKKKKSQFKEPHYDQITNDLLIETFKCSLKKLESGETTI